MMKRQTVRILSLLLALVMCLQFCPLGAFAAETDPEDVTQLTEEVTEDPSFEETPSGELTEADPTEPATDPAEPTEPVTAPTEPATETPAEPVTEPATEATEETPTEPVSEAVTEPGTEELTEEATLSEEDLYEQQLMAELDAQLAELNAHPRRSNVGSYASELAKFPASYQTLLKDLHAKHPNWVFVAVDTGLDWNTVIAAETGTKSTMEYNEGPNSIASHLLLNNRDGYYSASSYSGTRHYKPLDGRFVSASRAAVSYYMDPRNFLSENYVFMFESETYSNLMQVDGVTAILRKGCNTKNGMANKSTYITRSGNSATLASLSSQFGDTYSKIIYNIGKLTNVSPYFIASKIVQETSADTTTRVLTGTQSGYVGYYNFFNIGAYATADGTAWKNGLKYAKNHGWSNPILAIKGGIEFLAEKYITQGQDTAYYMRFNVSPKHTYELYDHQYMSATAAVAGEGSSTYKGYLDAGALDSAFLFYIPVYKNMPDKTSVVSLTPATTGKTTAQDILYNVPSATGKKLVTVPKGTSLTVQGGSVTSSEVYINRLYFPYWYKVEVKVSGKTYTGYIHEQSVSVGQVYHIKTGSTKSISSVTKITGGYSGPIYYETSDPTVATVSATTGLIKAVGSGTCTIYAISGGGSYDAIGIKVSSSGTKSSDKEGSGPNIGKPTNTSSGTASGSGSGSGSGTSTSGTAPVLSKIVTTGSGVGLKWKAFSGAESYNIYRKTTGNWKLIGSSFSTTYYDYDVDSGTKYTYTVRASVNGKLSGYDKTGLSILYLETPIMDMADAGSSGVTVTWATVKGAKGYLVYRKLDDGKWTLAKKLTSGTATSWVDTDELKLGGTYTYTVRAFNGSSKSYYDTIGVSAIILEEISKPDAPVLVSAANAPTGVTVKWKATAGATGYRVFRKSDGSKWKLIAKTTKTFYTDRKVTSNTKYTYTVRAVRGGKLSGYDSAGRSVLYLSAPGLVSAKSGTNSITVTWNATAGAKEYRIFRKSGSSKWKQIGKATGTSYTDKSGLSKGTKYSYTVRAVNGKTLSSYNSKGVSATFGNTLDIPAMSSIENAAKGIRFSWKAVSGAKSYQIYRKSGNGDWSKLATTSSLTYYDQTTALGSDYSYTVAAVSGSLTSDYSSGLSLRRLGAPALTSATAASNGITVKWSATKGAKSYYVMRKDSSGNWVILTTATGTSYTDNKGLTKGVTYTYSVQAVAGSSKSQYNTTGLSAKASADSPAELTSYVTTGSLNYRTGPGTSYPIAGAFGENKKVQVVKGASVKAGDYYWYKVQVDGNYYYAYSKYLKPA